MLLIRNRKRQIMIFYFILKQCMCADDNPALYPDLAELLAELAAYPAQTLKVLFFSPSHYYHQPG